jgi:hypothetical protein
VKNINDEMFYGAFFVILIVALIALAAWIESFNPCGG